MVNNENGKWSVALWVFGAICGVWLLTLTQGVIANDLRIEKECNEKYAKVIADISAIKVSMARIEEKICRIVK